MTDIDLLDAWLDDLAGCMAGAVRGLTATELAWRPHPDANGAGVTVWHIARWLDIIAVRVLRGGAAEDELWHTHGWAARTGYDPRGIGDAGLGAITGYTHEEADAVPVLDAPGPLTYFNEAVTELRAGLRALPPEKLHAPAASGRGRTIYQQLAPILQGGFKHLGEVEALNAQRTRLSTLAG
jgi:hypothetical protein